MDRLAALPTRVIPWETNQGAMNMALDVVAARRATETGEATVRTYGWSPSSLSLGYAQDRSTVDWEACEEFGVHVTRRPTGGGGILHEAWGDVSYSIVLPAESVPSELTAAYRQLCQPVIDTFDALDVPVEFAPTEREALYSPACYLRAVDPAHDLVTVADGRKVSGNAQYRQREAVIQHGSLRVNYDPDRMLGCFAEPGVTVDAVRERVGATEDYGVTALERVATGLADTLADTFDAQTGTWSGGERDNARDLVERKFAHDRWVRDRESVSATAE